MPDTYKIIPNTEESEFISAYFEAVYFTETGGFDDGQPPHDADLDDDFRKECIVDCMSFFQRSRPWLSDNQIAQAGHDFWLTRNGHGTGFWDKENIYPQAELLTKLAESYGGAYVSFEEFMT